ncbi:hypothetical protein ACVWXO_000257 [Bradyrhizobium sp. LM2.7]
MPIIRSIAAVQIGISKAVHFARKSGPLAVDPLVEPVVLDAVVPDQIEIALAAAGKLEQESRQLRRQALRVERARYEAERNRLVARSLERVWEEKLRVVETVE